MRTRVLTIALLAVRLAGQAAAQAGVEERPRPAVDVAAGWIGFADDGIVGESVVSGGARLYLLPRVSVGPEIAYISGSNHSHLVLTGNVTFDFLQPENGTSRQVTPYAVVGGGLFQTRERFRGETFTSSEGAFTVGGGVRARVSDRVTVGVDTRVGWELHIRLTGTAGVRLGR